MEESKGSEQTKVQKIVKEFEEKIQQAARMAGEKEKLNEDEKKQAEDLFKSIQGHMTWISRYEKDMDHHSKNLRGFSTEVANALASKVSMQRSKISDKMEELFTIYEHRDLDTAELDAQLNGVHKKTQEVLDNIETVIALALEERKEDSVIERSYREGDGTGLQKDGYPGTGGARLTDQDGQTPGMGPMGAMALAGNTLDGFHFQQGWPGSTSADCFDSNQMGSAAFEKAKQQFDPSGLFLPTPVLSGLTPDEQKSIERMHIESLKKLPNITRERPLVRLRSTHVEISLIRPMTRLYRCWTNCMEEPSGRWQRLRLNSAELDHYNPWMRMSSPAFSLSAVE